MFIAENERLESNFIMVTSKRVFSAPRDASLARRPLFFFLFFLFAARLSFWRAHRRFDALKSVSRRFGALISVLTRLYRRLDALRRLLTPI